MTTLLSNEFLCFLTAQYDKIDRENLISSLGDFYSYREALEAKTLLVSECEKANIVDSIKEFSIKRVEGKSGALRRVITDTVDIWTIVDREKAGNLGVHFVAQNPNRLPHVNADKFSLQFLIAEIKKLHEKIDKQSVEIADLKTLSQRTISDKANNKRKLSGSAEPFTPKKLLVQESRSSPFSTPTPTPAPSPAPTLQPGTASTSALSAPEPLTASSPSTASSSEASSSAASSSASSSSAAPSASAASSLSTASSSPTVPDPLLPPSSSSQRPTESVTETTATPAAKSKASYASKAKELKNSNSNWIDVTRKRKNIKPIVGTAETSTLEGVPPTKRDHWDIAVSRLKEGTSIDDVKNHLQQKSIQFKEVFVFPSKIKGTVAAKVRVSLDHKDLALSPASWPTGIRVSSWLNKSKSERKNDLERKNADKQNES